MTDISDEIKRIRFDLEEIPVTIRLNTDIESDWQLCGGITIPATAKGRTLKLPLYLAEILVFQKKATWEEREPYISVLELYEWIWGEENKPGLQKIPDDAYLQIKHKLNLIAKGKILTQASEHFIERETEKLNKGFKRLRENRISKVLRRVQGESGEGEPLLTSSEKELLAQIKELVNKWNKAIAEIEEE